MATRYTKNPRRTLIQEAADPATDTERLRYLANHKREEVRLAAIQNPGVPEDVWRKALLEGLPEAWSNPMAPIYLLGWSPQPGDRRTLKEAACHAMCTVWKLGKQVSPDGKSLLNSKILEWWVTSVSAPNMMDFLWNWSYGKYCEHRDVVRLFVLCVRTVPILNAKDRQALDLLEAWCTGQEEKLNEAKTLSYSCSHLVLVTIDLASNPSSWSNVQYIISELNEIVAFHKKKGVDLEEAVAEHDRLLADLIRREMPLPPQL